MAKPIPGTARCQVSATRKEFREFKAGRYPNAFRHAKSGPKALFTHEQLSPESPEQIVEADYKNALP
jgi:hypothetical protein